MLETEDSTPYAVKHLETPCTFELKPSTGDKN